MALTDLRNNATDYQGISQFDNRIANVSATNYQDARVNYIKIRENAPLADGSQATSGIHDDSKELPTIGYGFNLDAHSFAKINAFLTHSLGGTLTVDQQDALNLISAWKSGAPVTLTDTSGTTVTRILAPKDIIDGAAGASQFVELGKLQSIVLDEGQATVLLSTC